MKRLVIALMLGASLAAPIALNAQVEGYDLIIMNGRIVDGTGNPWF
jgi:Ni/Co efflux regulator RcnB